MKNPLLRAARDAWMSADDFRRRRDRFKRYTYGDQWSDPIFNGHKYIVERELIYLSGKQPYTNNLIRQQVKTIVGRFRAMAAERGYYDTKPGSADRRAQLPELDARLLEEFLISGMAIQRVDPQRGIENVNPRLFFINAVKDPCSRDVELIGQCHDLSLPEIFVRFGHGDMKRISRLREIFRCATSQRPEVELGIADDSDFFCAAPGKCRVIELWTLDAVSRLLCSNPDTGEVEYREMDELDEVERINDHRRAEGKPLIEVVPDIEFVWNCRWLSSNGHLLDCYPSPYSHGRHPYIMRLYPLTDGEIHPFVEDIIDQQRVINRLIVMIDKMMASSAKGVLLFPLDQLPEGTPWEDVYDAWSRSDGVIPVTGSGSWMPQQVVTNTDGAGAYRMLELQMKLFNNISGIGDALRGQNIGGTAGAAMYDRQVENATIALGDLLETFASLIEERTLLCKQLSSGGPSAKSASARKSVGAG